MKSTSKASQSERMIFVRDQFFSDATYPISQQYSQPNNTHAIHWLLWTWITWDISTVSPDCFLHCNTMLWDPDSDLSGRNLWKAIFVLQPPAGFSQWETPVGLWRTWGMVGEPAIHRLPLKLLRFGTATSLSPQLPSPGSLSSSENFCSIEIFVLFYPCNSSRFYLDLLRDL